MSQFIPVIIQDKTHIKITLEQGTMIIKRIDNPAVITIPAMVGLEVNQAAVAFQELREAISIAKQLDSKFFSRVSFETLKITQIYDGIIFTQDWLKRSR